MSRLSRLRPEGMSRSQWRLAVASGRSSFQGRALDEPWVRNALDQLDGRLFGLFHSDLLLRDAQAAEGRAEGGVVSAQDQQVLVVQRTAPAIEATASPEARPSDDRGRGLRTIGDLAAEERRLAGVAFASALVTLGAARPARLEAETAAIDRLGVEGARRLAPITAYVGAFNLVRAYDHAPPIAPLPPDVIDLAVQRAVRPLLEP